MSRRFTLLLSIAGLLAGLMVIASCDSAFDGEKFENQPPNTTLAVRDTSLVERRCTIGPDGQLCTPDDNLFLSTIFMAWSGSDPDGFVVGFDMRFYDYDDNPGPEDLWSFTTSRDTIILLPIPPGQQIAKVVFEVRAIDNEGLKDPDPARTVFPIINSPPTIRFDGNELPRDTTWTIFSFAWEASDPDGQQDLAAVEVAFNDTTQFVELPPDVTFVSFVADAPVGAQTADARVYLGRGFTSTNIIVPGVRLDDDNTIHIRARDRTGATSNVRSFPDPDLEQHWFVRQPKSNVLLVNDYRTPRAHEAMPFHRATLTGYTGTATYDEWDLSQPTSGGVHSDGLPPSANPTLAQILKLWDFIYWVSDSVTDTVIGKNLAMIAGFIDGFFADGGRMFVHVPFTAPPGGEIDFGNPAYDLLPVEAIVTRPNSSVPPRLAIQDGALIEPMDAMPGTGRAFPVLRSEGLNFMLPFSIPSGVRPLAVGQFVDRDNNNAPWMGDSFVASMDSERRVGLIALNLYSRNRYNFTGEDGNLDDPCLAVQYVLESLTFPGQPGTCPTPSGHQP